MNRFVFVPKFRASITIDSRIAREIDDYYREKVKRPLHKAKAYRNYRMFMRKL